MTTKEIIPFLQEVSPVSSSPFVKNEKIEDIKVKTVKDFEKLKDTVKNNPFFDKLQNTEDDFAKKSYAVQKPPSGMRKSDSFQLEVPKVNTQAIERREDTDGDSRNVLEILRNFDSKSKTEKILFSSDKTFKRVEIPKHVVTALSKPVEKNVQADDKIAYEIYTSHNESSKDSVGLKRVGSVSDRRKLFEKSIPVTEVKQIQKALQLTKMSSEQIEKPVPDLENTTSIAERSKNFEIPIPNNSLSRSMSVVERKKMFQKNVPRAPNSLKTFGTNTSSTTTGKRNIFKQNPEFHTTAPIMKKDSNFHGQEKPQITSKIAVSNIDVPLLNQKAQSMSNAEEVLHVTSNTMKPIGSVSSMINKFQSSTEKLDDKPFLNIKKNSSVSHFTIQVEHSSNGDPTEMESKRSDSGAFTDETEKKLNSSVMNIPKIEIGSIFDEQDTWMSSLLTSDTFVEEEIPGPTEKGVAFLVPKCALEDPKPPNIEETPISTNVVAKEKFLDQEESLFLSKREELKSNRRGVTFGTAWDGSLTEVRYIGNDTNEAEPPEAKGRLLLKCRFFLSSFFY
jgi:hypothetical protein